MPKCAECCTDFKKTRPGRRQDYCSSACKAAFHNRRAMRGATCYDVLVLAAANPARGIELKARLDLQLELWAAEDEKAGRVRTTRRLFDVGFDLPRTDVVTYQL